jgi:hypothetical protein
VSDTDPAPVMNHDPEPGDLALEAAMRPLKKFAYRFGYHVDQHPVLQKYIAQEMEAFAGLVIRPRPPQDAEQATDVQHRSLQQYQVGEAVFIKAGRHVRKVGLVCETTGTVLRVIFEGRTIRSVRAASDIRLATEKEVRENAWVKRWSPEPHA